MMELINNIPSDWEITKLKFFSKIFGRIGFRGYTASDLVDEGEGAITLGPPNIVNQKLNLENKRYLSWEKYEESPEIKVYNGDLLLVKTASVGKVALVENLNEPATINPQLVVFKNININSKFFYYTMVSDVIQFQIAKNLNGGVISTLSQENIRNYVIPLPESSEQHNITDYLDNHIDRINNIISLNENLISLLEEKRTVLINQVVTKGLNPDVPMKDSGVEWIGEIPEHWSISRLKFLINKNAQYGANCEPEPDETKFDYRYVRITDIDDDASLKDNIVYLCKEDAKGFVLKEGDILFARSGATVGKTYLYDSSDGDCCFAGYLIRYVPNKLLLNPKYLLYFSFSKSYTEWIKIVSTQATIQNVSADKYDNLIISLPDVDEQNKIVSFLDDKITNINKTISKIQENINLLEEYKTSLIHHVVTGKIDVRGEEI